MTRPLLALLLFVATGCSNGTPMTSNGQQDGAVDGGGGNNACASIDLGIPASVAVAPLNGGGCGIARISGTGIVAIDSGVDVWTLLDDSGAIGRISGPQLSDLSFFAQHSGFVGFTLEPVACGASCTARMFTLNVWDDAGHEVHREPILQLDLSSGTGPSAVAVADPTGGALVAIIERGNVMARTYSLRRYDSSGNVREGPAGIQAQCDVDFATDVNGYTLFVQHCSSDLGQWYGPDLVPVGGPFSIGIPRPPPINHGNPPRAYVPLTDGGVAFSLGGVWQAIISEKDGAEPPPAWLSALDGKRLTVLSNRRGYAALPSLQSPMESPCEVTVSILAPDGTHCGDVKPGWPGLSACGPRDVEISTDATFVEQSPGDDACTYRLWRNIVH